MENMFKGASFGDKFKTMGDLDTTYDIVSRWEVDEKDKFMDLAALINELRNLGD